MTRYDCNYEDKTFKNFEKFSLARMDESKEIQKSKVKAECKSEQVYAEQVRHRATQESTAHCKERQSQEINIERKCALLNILNDFKTIVYS